MILINETKESNEEVLKIRFFNKDEKKPTLFFSTKDKNKNHCRYKISGLLCDLILKKYRLYDIPLLKRKWFKEEK